MPDEPTETTTPRGRVRTTELLDAINSLPERIIAGIRAAVPEPEPEAEPEAEPESETAPEVTFEPEPEPTAEPAADGTAESAQPGVSPPASTTPVSHAEARRRSGFPTRKRGR